MKNDIEFQNYINSYSPNEILTELITNQELNKTIIDNNLLWKKYEYYYKKIWF